MRYKLVETKKNKKLPENLLRNNIHKNIKTPVNEKLTNVIFK